MQIRTSGLIFSFKTYSDVRLKNCTTDIPFADSAVVGSS